MIISSEVAYGNCLARQCWSVGQFWLVLSNQPFIGFYGCKFTDFFSGFHHKGSTFTGTDQIGPEYRIGPDCAGCA